MNYPADVEAQIAAIRRDDTHGASWLSRQAILAVARFAEQVPAVDARDLREGVRACIAELAAARPEMAPIRHWMEQLDREVESVATDGGDLTALRAEIVTAAQRLIAPAETANRRAAENAVARLPARSVVFTASYSQTVVDACRLAGQAGKLRRLLVAESADPSGHRYGQLLANAVAGAVPEIEVIPDDRAPDRVREADRVWLGADTVLPDGSVLNGTPSLPIARAGRQAYLPVELIGESAKIQFPTSHASAPIRELPPGPSGMERVPAEYVTAMITEDETILWPLRPPSPKHVGTTVTLTPSSRERGPEATYLVARIAELLTARGEVVAVAESSAGGRICDLLTDRPGSSAWFVGGIVAYSGASKHQMAGLSAEATRQHGAVSVETARGLAEGAIRLFDAAWGIGETGIAGPQIGRRSSKTAGLACLAVAGPDNQGQAIEINTGLDDRAANKEAFAIEALRLLVSELER
jgi:PncC family amidohydrolase